MNELANLPINLSNLCDSSLPSLREKTIDFHEEDAEVYTQRQIRLTINSSLTFSKVQKLF
jgi:hypothetical protein